RAHALSRAGHGGGVVLVRRPPPMTGFWTPGRPFFPISSVRPPRAAANVAAVRPAAPAPTTSTSTSTGGVPPANAQPFFGSAASVSVTRSTGREGDVTLRFFAHPLPRRFFLNLSRVGPPFLRRDRAMTLVLLRWYFGGSSGRRRGRAGDQPFALLVSFTLLVRRSIT